MKEQSMLENRGGNDRVGNSFQQTLNPWRNQQAVRSLVLASSLLLASLAQAAEPLQSFLETYCLRCHNAQKQEGAFRLDTLPHDFANQTVAQRWSEVVFRMNAGEMPPKKESQPRSEELGRVVEWLSTQIKAGEALRMARRGPVAHYRLSREEYGYTIYDLLGTHYDVTAPGAFNDDPRWHGFDRLGSLLSLSPSHVERYLRAAETIVSRAFPDQVPQTNTSRRLADDGKWQEKGLAGPIRWALWPGHGQAAMQVRFPGLYRIRLQVSALPSFRGRLPHLALWHHGLKRAVVGQDVLAAEDKPTTIEIEAFLPEGDFDVLNQSPGMLSDGQTPRVSQFPFVNTTVSREKRPQGYKLYDDQERLIFPLLIVDWVELEGPIHLSTDEKKREGLIPIKNDPAEVRDCLNRFATRAWRRPVTNTEMERFVKIIEGEQAAGESFGAAYRSALVGLLTSKSFYYLEEGSAGEKRDRVNDWELASRLSYFLWSSLPDESLRAAAAAGHLHESAVLKQQVERMLGDPKILRFTNSFPKQWLQLHRVGQFPADAELYPDYDKWLEESMILESVYYFDTVFRENRPLREFLDSDWTMLNPRLALHYGLPAVPAAGFHKVTLRPQDHRGGLLTQASILSLTSDGVRHRPVHRGVWISEAVFARTPPPPPPNVEPLEPTPSDKPKATIRQQLEAHASHTVCASCHAKIDPLGLAFDHYDAIGRWRTTEKVVGGLGADPPVQASGILADGRSYDSPEQFKQRLIEDIDRFAEAFVEQLATYALRRVMTMDDRSQIKAIAAASRSDDYRLRTVLLNLLASPLFQQR